VLGKWEKGAMCSLLSMKKIEEKKEGGEEPCMKIQQVFLFAPAKRLSLFRCYLKEGRGGLMLGTLTGGQKKKIIRIAILQEENQPKLALVPIPSKARRGEREGRGKVGYIFSSS